VKSETGYWGTKSTGENVTDYLLVHGAGQGAWSWGKVWGHMTAPVEHPPPLYRQRQALRVRAVDLPGQGSDAALDAGLVDMSEGVRAITNVVEREGFTDYIIAAHELGGTVALRALSELSAKPKRLVLVAGIVPSGRSTPVSAYPLMARTAVGLCKTLGALTGRDIQVPKSIVSNYVCQGLDPMQQVETVGHLGPLPLRMLTQSVDLDLENLPCPVTYVVLGNDRLIAPSQQRAMAARIPGATVIELDAAHQAAAQKPRELAELLLAV
jgi:pimeloyl-ACP methyl ester carboxylesterase